jgi:thiol-disulfide isomerase/thioredoxin
MKNLFLFLLPAIIFFGCSRHQIVRDTAPVIVGKIEKSMLSNNIYPWFGKNYNEYNYIKKTVDEIKENKGKDSILVFMGTWCDDSKREIPKFFKIMEISEFSNYSIIGLDRKKKSPEGKEIFYDIKNVPTFIIISDGREIGRIIETPEKTLEEDILKILKKKK